MSFPRNQCTVIGFRTSDQPAVGDGCKFVFGGIGKLGLMISPIYNFSVGFDYFFIIGRYKPPAEYLIYPYFQFILFMITINFIFYPVDADDAARFRLLFYFSQKEGTMSNA